MAKYVKLKSNKIIIFSECYSHSDFKHLEPVSAGFIRFFAIHEFEVHCECYGESVMLGLKAASEDTQLAFNQLLTLD